LWLPIRSSDGLPYRARSDGGLTSRWPVSTVAAICPIRQRCLKIRIAYARSLMEAQRYAEADCRIEHAHDNPTRDTWSLDLLGFRQMKQDVAGFWKNYAAICEAGRGPGGER
jgi:hypothetical protein